MIPGSEIRPLAPAGAWRWAALLALALLAGACATPFRSPSSALRVATWNLEHLAEDGARGCRPRTDADYADLRAFAARLDADVVAFQEVESAAAAARVFDPAIYDVVIEARPRADAPAPACRGLEGRSLTHQAVGFAIRKSIPFERARDLTELQDGDPNLRSGVDVTLRRKSEAPLRLLAVHLKSGCPSGGDNEACIILRRQVPVLEGWIDARAREGVRFAVLGDFNRRLGLPGDAVWTELDDADPPNADLALAAEARTPGCDPRYTAFIDHIVLDRRASRDLLGFEELTYDPGRRLSDHCPLVARIR